MTQALDVDNNEIVFLSPIRYRMFTQNGVDHIGVMSLVETAPRLGTSEAHPGIVPAEIGE